ncbi:MAG: DUF4288 domain-containing protein [Bacteroidetes bacterium]|nr:DUF4288 domain-containing protein [Bacteroidota bacterium]
MKTFVAQIVYRIECEEQSTDQYEEQWRLIFAEDEPLALKEAQKVAKDEEATIIDRHGRTIIWKLVAVKDLQPIEIGNGELLFSVVKEVEPIAAPVWVR